MPKTGTEEMAKLAGGFVEVVVAQEAQVLHMIGALAHPVTPATEAEAAKHEAETEAAFDNMPI